MRHVLSSIAAAAVLLAAARAAAHEPPRWHAGGSVGFSHLWGGPTSPGFGAGIHVNYAFNDMFSLLSALDASAHPYSRWVIVSGGLGAAYAVDVGRFTPHVGALAGPAGLLSVNPTCGLSIAEPCRAFRLSAGVLWGIDYQISNRFAVGLAGRFQLLLLGDHPWMTLGIFAKAEYTWGSTGPR